MGGGTTDRLQRKWNSADFFDGGKHTEVALGGYVIGGENKILINRKFAERESGVKIQRRYTRILQRVVANIGGWFYP